MGRGAHRTAGCWSLIPKIADDSLVMRPFELEYRDEVPLYRPELEDLVCKLPREMNVEDCQGYILHDLNKLDTLAGLAIKYGVEVMDIKRANNLTSDMQMFARKFLKIPLPGSHSPGATLYSQAQDKMLRPNRGLTENDRPPASASNAGADRTSRSKAMEMLRGYYGLESPPSIESDKGVVSGRNFPMDVAFKAPFSEEVSGSGSSNRWALKDGDSLQVEWKEQDTSRAKAGTTLGDARIEAGPGIGEAERDHLGDGPPGMSGQLGWMNEKVKDDSETGASAFDGLQRKGESWEVCTEWRDDSECEAACSDGNCAKVISSSKGGTGNSVRGPRLSQAQQVAAVVEELVQVHRDRRHTIEMAGTSRGLIGEEDFQQDRLTRRRARGEIPAQVPRTLGLPTPSISKQNSSVKN